MTGELDDILRKLEEIRKEDPGFKAAAEALIDGEVAHTDKADPAQGVIVAAGGEPAP